MLILIMIMRIFSTMLILVRKIVLTSPLSPPPPPIDNIFGKNSYGLVKILGNVGQNVTTPPPPPNVDGFDVPARRKSRLSSSSQCFLSNHNARQFILIRFLDLLFPFAAENSEDCSNYNSTYMSPPPS